MSSSSPKTIGIKLGQIITERGICRHPVHDRPGQRQRPGRRPGRHFSPSGPWPGLTDTDLAAIRWAAARMSAESAARGYTTRWRT
jgi:hypothetical protein